MGGAVRPAGRRHLRDSGRDCRTRRAGAERRAHAARQERTANSATTDLDAYDFYLRGRKCYYEYSAAVDRDGHPDVRPGYRVRPRVCAGLCRTGGLLVLPVLFRSLRCGSGTGGLGQQQGAADGSAIGAVAGVARPLALVKRADRRRGPGVPGGGPRSIPGFSRRTTSALATALRWGGSPKQWKHTNARWRRDPDDYQSPLLAAQIEDDLGRGDRAAALRKRGIGIAERRLLADPGDARTLYMAANGLAALGERERARQFAERALAAQPGDPMLLYNVGCVFSILGLTEPALDCLEKAARAGVAPKAWCENDSNLDAVRGELRFQRLLGELI